MKEVKLLVSTIVGSVFLICVMSAPAYAVGPYVVTDIGVLSGYGQESQAFSINSMGQVVGRSESSAGTVHRGAFLWTPTHPNDSDGSKVNLGRFSAGINFDVTVAHGVNDRGQAAGSSNTAAGTRAFIWTPTSPNGTAGTMTSLVSAFDLRTAVANGINSHGQAVGYVDGYSSGFYAFLWTPETPNGKTGSAINLGNLPWSDYSVATAINSVGQVTGIAQSYTEGVPGHPFLWTPNFQNGTEGSMVDLGELSDDLDHAWANGINSFGQVTGSAYSRTIYQRSRAFLWTPSAANETDGSMVDLGFLPGGDAASSAFGVNSNGAVVGDSTVGLFPGQQSQIHHAFVWLPNGTNQQEGTMFDLNTLLDPATGAGWIIQSARAINDRGQIVGIGIYDPDGPFGARERVRAVLLTPVPEPSSWALLAASAALSLVVFSRGRMLL